MTATVALRIGQLSRPALECPSLTIRLNSLLNYPRVRIRQVRKIILKFLSGWHVVLLSRGLNARLCDALNSAVEQSSNSLNRVAQFLVSGNRLNKKFLQKRDPLLCHRRLFPSDAFLWGVAGKKLEYDFKSSYQLITNMQLVVRAKG